MKKINIVWIAISILTLISLYGCEKKRISYTDMIKREDKEVSVFMDKQGFTVLNNMPNRALASNEFVKIKDGLYLNVIKKGEIIEENKVNVLTRFSAVSIGDRVKLNFNSADQTNQNPYPLPFIYMKGSDKPILDPQAPVLEQQYSNYLCSAMIDAIEYVGIGGKVKMIVSFRNGPTFATKDGIAIYFDNMTFTKKP